MLKKPWTTIFFALALAIPAAAFLRASDDPPEDRVIVLPDEQDIDVDVEVDDPEAMVVRIDREHGRGYVGVRLVGITPELREHFGVPRDAGVLVGGVEPDSPAAKAGIRVGDILTAVDGDRIDSARDLSRAVRRKKAGQTVQLDLSRDRAKKQLTVTVTERPAKEIRVGELHPHLRKRAFVWHDGDFSKSLIGPLEDMGCVERRLDELEKRLKDLEKKLPSK
ncbi:MAG: S1C family serine protease [Thermoanaerobaculia bacterium]